MFHIGNTQILTPEMEVLLELRSQLAINGIKLFEKFIETQDHIQFNCPSHKGGQENKPSCGITKNDIIQDLGNGKKKVVEAGTVHCFQCGYTTSLPEMISDCFGKNDGGLFGIKWLTENFLTQSIESRKPIQFNFGRNQAVKKEPIKYISEEELDTYRYIHPYMYQRKLTDEIIDMFDVGYDSDFVLRSKTTGMEKHLKCITFPVRDITGGTLFIARRCVDNKIFHYPEGVTKPLYGIYELSKLPEFPKKIYVCESIIDSLTLWTHHKYSVAMNGLGTPLQYEQLSNMPCRHIVLATDSDEKGMEARSRLRKNVRNKLFTEVILPQGRKDINECTFEEIENLQETNLI
jgi:hypothetical protein